MAKRKKPAKKVAKRAAARTPREGGRGAGASSAGAAASEPVELASAAAPPDRQLSLEQIDALVLLATTLPRQIGDLIAAQGRFEATQGIAMEAIRAQLAKLEAEHVAPAAVPTAGQLTFECRVTLAGACRTLKLEKPTPPIVGRVMHDKKAFDPKTAQSPAFLMQAIVDADKGNLHLTASARAKVAASDSKFCSAHLDKRLPLLVNTGLVAKEAKTSGGRTSYERHLTTKGQEVFNGWPEWTDPTGGLGLKPEPPPSPTPAPSPAPTPPEA